MYVEQLLRKVTHAVVRSRFYVGFKVERFCDLVINLTRKISTSFGAHCNTTSLHFIENILVFFHRSACYEFKAEKEFSYKKRSANIESDDKFTH